jgi:hypothetical protein
MKLLTIIITLFIHQLSFAQCVNGYIGNGDFELGNLEEFWSLDDGGHVQSDVVHEGNYAFLCGNGGGAQLTRVTPNTNYQLSFWLKTDDDYDNFNVRINNRSQDFEIFNTDGWKQFTLNFDALPNENTIYIWFYGGYTYVDDVVFSSNYPFNTYGSIAAEIGCDPFIAPSGKSFLIPGTYEDTIPNAFGCDSLITLQLTGIAENVSVLFDGKKMVTTISATNYQWVNVSNNYQDIPGATEDFYIAPENGVYLVKVIIDNCTYYSNEVVIKTADKYGYMNDITDIAFHNNDLYVSYHTGYTIGILEDISYGQPEISERMSGISPFSGITGIKNGIVISGNYIYVTVTDEALQIKKVNINEGESLTEESYLNATSAFRPVIYSDQLYYFNPSNNSIETFNTQDINPVISSFYTDMTDVTALAAYQNYLYVAHGNSISKLNLLSQNPIPEFVITTTSAPQSLVFYNNELYYTLRSEGTINKVNVNNASPVSSVEKSGLSYPSAMAVYNNEVFVVSNNKKYIYRFPFSSLLHTNSLKPLNTIRFYPNPTHGKLFFDSNNIIQKMSIKDITGKTLMLPQINKNEIDLSSFPRGVYFITYTTNNQSGVYKVVKQ